MTAISTLATGLSGIDEPTCVELIQSETVGHLALTSAALPVVFPILYHVVDRSVVFASDSALTLSAARHHAVACVGIDGQRGASHWAVLLMGRLREVIPPLPIGRDGIALRPWGLASAQHYVALEIELIDGATSTSQPDTLTNDTQMASTATDETRSTDETSNS
jgi:hypothetical protein